MLYDHSTDPGENVNISEYPSSLETVEELSRLMRAVRAPHYFE
jgi:hypothetical protein